MNQYLCTDTQQQKKSTIELSFFLYHCYWIVEKSVKLKMGDIVVKLPMLADTVLFDDV